MNLTWSLKAYWLTRPNIRCHFRFNFNRFGTLTLSNGKLFQPTDLYRPNSVEALELAELNGRNRLTLMMAALNKIQMIFLTSGSLPLIV